jgi:hypothetical protein
VGAAVVSVFLVAAAVTIAPAMAFLWYLLSRYEGYFQDARVFFALTVGFFAGLVVAFLENVAFQFDSPRFTASAGAATAFLFFVGGYAFVESAAKTSVLGFGQFRKRKDTPYYGAALGIGFGAMVALQSVALALHDTSLLIRAFTASTATAFALIVLSGAGAVLVSGAAGVWIGKGSADGRLWSGLAWGSLLTMPSLAFLWFFRPALATWQSVSAPPAALLWLAIVPAVASLVYGVGLVAYTQTKILDNVVPPEIRDLVDKERRRERRERMRAP